MANTKDILKDVQKHIGNAQDSLNEAISALNDSDPSDGDNYSDFISELTETISLAVDQVETADGECSNPVMNGGEEEESDDDDDTDEKEPASVL